MSGSKRGSGRAENARTSPEEELLLACRAWRRFVTAGEATESDRCMLDLGRLPSALSRWTERRRQRLSQVAWEFACDQFLDRLSQVVCSSSRLELGLLQHCWKGSCVDGQRRAARLSRQQSIEGLAALATSELRPEDLLIGREELTRLVRCLGFLSSRQRRVLLLRSEGFSFREIAEKEVCSETAARNLAFQGRANVRSMLGSDASVSHGGE